MLFSFLISARLFRLVNSLFFDWRVVGFFLPTGWQFAWSSSVFSFFSYLANKISNLFIKAEMISKWCWAGSFFKFWPTLFGPEVFGATSTLCGLFDTLVASPLELSTVPPPPGSLQKVRFIKGVVNKDSLKLKTLTHSCLFLILLIFYRSSLMMIWLWKTWKLLFIYYVIITYLFICLFWVIKNMQ